MLDAVPALTGDISDGHGRTDPTHNGPSGEYPTRGGKSIRRLRRRPQRLSFPFRTRIVCQSLTWRSPWQRTFISPPELESFARACVEGGNYNNVSEVVRSGLRLLKEQEERRRVFDAMIARTLEEADDKGTRTMDDVLARADAAIGAAQR